MTGHNSRPTRFHGGVTLREYLEKIVELKIDAMIEASKEARRLMEVTMAGFPAEYAKKGELLVTANSVQELKDKELSSLKLLVDTKLGKIEYEDKHNTLLEKIDLLKESKDVMEGRASQSSVTRSTIIAIIGLLVGIAAALRAFKI